MSDLVSIIVPVYNSEEYIAECIESIISQTYENIELILIDDGSVDNSKNIIQSYMEIDKRVKYFYQNNSGPSTARNKGINECNGMFIVFIDSDDWIDSNMIQEMMYEINKNKSDLVLCDFILETEIESVYNKILPKNNNIDLMELKEKLISSDILNSPWSKIYRKEIIVNNNIKFNNILHAGEDQIFNMQYISYINNVSYINKGFYHYRMVKNSTCRKIYKNKIEMLELQQNIRSSIINNWIDYKYKYRIESAKWFLQNIASHCYLASITLRKNERKEILDTFINSKITKESLDITYNKKLSYDANIHKIFIPLIRLKNKYLIIFISRIYCTFYNFKKKLLK